MLKHSLKTGFSFGVTSGVITTLGLMVGLNSGTSSKLVVIGGIVTIAFADAFSDALGIHVSEESEGKHTPREIWQATAATFTAKLLFSLTFIIPILIFTLDLAIVVNLVWGFLLLGISSCLLARQEKIKPAKVICEHLAVAVIVVGFSQLIGTWIKSVFR